MGLSGAHPAGCALFYAAFLFHQKKSNDQKVLALVYFYSPNTKLAIMK